MGNYITQTDILDRVPEQKLIGLTDDDNNGVINDTVVNNNIIDTESLIDSYLKTKYTVPLSPVPAILKKIAKDISEHFLYQRRLGSTESIMASYNNAIKFLEKVAAGTISLGVDTPAPDSGVGINYSSSDRTFTRDTLKNF
ncbi:DUF1320 domain-containing protein [Candidatus Desantisbacteria bacterium]|nr:DUF1320 domain-containing protein [Candidatus Desantisbacteria bacterium]